jgi:hypothetical protein
MSELYIVNQTISEKTAAGWTSNVTSDAYPLTRYDQGGFVFSWDTMVGTLTTTTFILQVSNDGTNWADLITAIGMTTTSGCVQSHTEKTAFNYVRSVATIGAATSGNFKITASFK